MQPTIKIIPRVHLSPNIKKIRIETNKSKFIKNPTINPITGRQIIKNGKTYNKLIKLYNISTEELNLGQNDDIVSKLHSKSLNPILNGCKSNIKM